MQLLLCHWTQRIFLVGSRILLLMVVQQLVTILVLSQEEMSTGTSTLPSWTRGPFFFLSFAYFLIAKHSVRLSSFLFTHVFITCLSRGYRKSCTMLGMRNTAVDKFSQSSHSNLVLFLSFWFTDVFPENDNGVKKDKRRHSILGSYQIEEGLAKGQGLWIYCSLLTY